MKQNKRYLSLLLAVSLVFPLLFSACNTQRTPPTQEASQSPSIAPAEDVSQAPSSQKSSPESVESSLAEEPVKEEKPEEKEETKEEKKSYPYSRPLKEISAISDQEVLEQISMSWEELSAFDNTSVTWGPGPTQNEVRPAAPVELQNTYGEYGALFIAPESPQIYLTFDEGYDAGYNEEILDVLKEKEVSALFFVTLGFVRSRPDLVQRMLEEGHAIGNHSVYHISFPDMELMDCAKDVLYLHRYMEENFGYEMTVCRPPAGAFSPRTLVLLQELGYTSMFWSFAYRDWLLDEQPAPAEGLATVIGRSHPGAIYLLHAVSSTNAEILPEAIDELHKKGYEIIPWEKP